MDIHALLNRGTVDDAPSEDLVHVLKRELTAAIRAELEPVQRRLDDLERLCATGNKVSQERILRSTEKSLPSVSSPACPSSHNHFLRRRSVFHLFRLLPPEVRIKIWQMAAPEGRFFEPVLEPIRQMPLSEEQGLDPPFIMLEHKYKNPAIRAVSRESRVAMDRLGGFEFGLFNTARGACWFNYERDMVFIHTDMFDKLNLMNLRQIRALAFGDAQFKTHDGCANIIRSVRQHAPSCSTILFCFCTTTVQNSSYLRISGSKFRILEDGDFVGHFDALGFPSGPVRWRALRDTIYHIWARPRRRRGNATKKTPSLIGIDITKEGRWERLASR